MRMAKLLSLCIFLLFSLYHTTPTSASAAATTSSTTKNLKATSFIKASCRATQYPLLCFQSLSTYASTIQQSQLHLAQAALTVTLAKAKSTTAFVFKMTKAAGITKREYQAIKDCTANMVHTVDQLSLSVTELGQMGRSNIRSEDFTWHASNVQTWVSTALTDQNMCLDGFGSRMMEGNVKVAIRSRVVNTAQVTSVALALVNRFAERHI